MFSCAAERGIDFCVECKEYPCTDLKQFQSERPHRIELWDDLEQIRVMGYKHWLKNIRGNYTCPKCQSINSAYDLKCRTCGEEPSCSYAAKHKHAIEQVLKNMWNVFLPGTKSSSSYAPAFPRPFFDGPVTPFRGPWSHSYGGLTHFLRVLDPSLRVPDPSLRVGDPPSYGWLTHSLRVPDPSLRGEDPLPTGQLYYPYDTITLSLRVVDPSLRVLDPFPTGDWPSSDAEKSGTG